MQNIKSKKDLQAFLTQIYPIHKMNTIKSWASQIWPFLNEMKIGDWIVTPSKSSPIVHVARITSEYEHNAENPAPYVHFRKVEWFAHVPKNRFEQDLLYSMGAFMTICRIQRNDVEQRIKNIVGGQKEDKQIDDIDEEIADVRDVESDAFEEISSYVIRRFKGHGLADIVDSILRAKGYNTYKSPLGPDKGVDILAASGPLGFDQPRLLVQVKSGEGMVDRPILDQLVGAMTNFKAEFGLLVSWYGFKNSVVAEMKNQYFKVKFWDARVILKELFDCYDQLEDDMKSKLPLKRIWVLDAGKLE